jgi:hypothetical protein
MFFIGVVWLVVGIQILWSVFRTDSYVHFHWKTRFGRYVLGTPRMLKFLEIDPDNLTGAMRNRLRAFSVVSGVGFALLARWVL